MGMYGADSDEGRVPAAEINVTPLADVMLVLLIIFMITAPLMSHRVKIDLPRANPHTQAGAIQVPPIDLAIEADGSLYWNDTAIDATAFNARLRTAASKQPQPALNIRADKATPYRIIWTVLQDAKTAGMVHVGFITKGTGRSP